MHINLNGKNALVCGGSQGIGAAIAKLFAQAGANVTILARDLVALENTKNGLTAENGQKHDFIQADLNDLSQLEILIRNKINQNGGYHILVNNTGGPSPGLLHNCDYSAIENAFRQHILSAQLIARILTEPMKQFGYGRIINIISIGLKQPIENLGVSNTIRGAMGSWAKTLASELAQYGITVNNILPGYTSTERLNHLLEFRAAQTGTNTEAIIEGIVRSIPAARMASPEEIGYAALFLSSSLASYINGINMPVDGGYLKTL